MKTHKQCKGINKAKCFKGCGKEVLAQTRKYGLCMSCYRDWLLNTKEGEETRNKAIIKAQKPRKDLERAEQEHKKNKSLEWLKKNVVNVCHDFIKLRDKYKPCISCNQPWHSGFQAGHCNKAELFSTLKYHETNIHGQCMGCNIDKDGNESEFRLGLINRYGKEYVDELDKLALLDHQTNFKWDRQELIKIREYYKQKIKEL